LAYTFNYAFGLVLYVLFVAYGPRNLLPGAVDSLLYTSWPEAKLLTTQMNTNTNVFPSLHTSLSTTVVLLAHQTRRTYPVWYFLSTGIAGSIVLATLYLGIHWGTDALAGVVLALASVVAARRYDPVRTISARFETDRAKRVLGRMRESRRD
jgi:membrane-associated phospholipid phosphatase